MGRVEVEADEAKRFRSDLNKRMDRMENQANKNEAVLRFLVQILKPEYKGTKLTYLLKDGKPGGEVTL